MRKNEKYSYDESKFTLRLTTDMKDYLDCEAKKYGFTRTDYIRHLISQDRIRNSNDGEVK